MMPGPAICSHSIKNHLKWSVLGEIGHSQIQSRPLEIAQRRLRNMIAGGVGSLPSPKSPSMAASARTWPGINSGTILPAVMEPDLRR
jgi:hypothetical protein